MQWLDKAKGQVAPGSSPVFAQRGEPSSITNNAQDIGHGHDSYGTTGTLTELADILTTPRVSPASKRIPITITDISVKPSSIRDIMKFHNAEGVYLVEHPQTITITQGNGKTANVTLYPEDTIFDVAERINTAISESLGQGAYTNNQSKFCTIADGSEGTSESVSIKEDVYRTKYLRNDNGNLILDENNNPIVIGTEYSGKRITYSTILIRSAVPGKDGELYFSGDEDLLNALGLNTIQESSESRFTALVYDAHSGTKVNTMTAESGEFKSIIPPEIDIDIDPMTTAISASWDESTKRFMFSHSQSYMAMLHLKDNGVTFQTGANMGEDFSIQLGDMSANALNLSRVNVATRETASRSISLLDRAISRVSSQRAKVGAYINSLERTMTNLTTTSANLTEADSRLRDADMALTMMDFVRLQILNQSGTSMLAQSNQMPQSVLNLLGN